MKNLIIIPAYNEEKALPQTVAMLDVLPAEYKVLVVNDGSSDATGAVAQRLAGAATRPLYTAHLSMNSGIGAAVQTGYRFAATQGDYKYVIQFDGDGQHPAAAIPELVRACEADGLDLCIGSRFLTSDRAGYRSTFSRRMGIRFFAYLIGLLTGSKVTDPTSGLRCAGPRAWRNFARRYPEDFPEPESLFWCVRNGLRVGELPVRMLERQAGASSIQQARAMYYMVKVSLAILVDRLRQKDEYQI